MLSRNKKQAYLLHTWSDKAFKCTVVNRTLSSLPGGSLEITLTVPLSAARVYFQGVDCVSLLIRGKMYV